MKIKTTKERVKYQFKHLSQRCERNLDLIGIRGQVRWVTLTRSLPVTPKHDTSDLLCKTGHRMD